MSGTSSTSVVAGGVGDVGGGCYYKPPFTAVQWQELEHQAMVYKYLLAGLPVPPELVVPIRRSFEAISSRFFSNPALGYYSYYGKKFDPEPGRCRRTDGKKWRCAKDAYPDSRYCERHMHRGRNRSRKPVESHSTSSQSVSSATSHVVTGGSSISSSGIFQNNSGSSTFQNMTLHSVVNSESLYSGTSLTKLQMDPGLYGSNNKDYRYVHGFSSDADPENFSPEASGNVRNLGVGSDLASAWCLLPSQVSSSSLLRSQNEQNQLHGQSLELDMAHALDPIMEATLSKQQRHKQHSLFSNEIGSAGSPMKQEPHSAMRPFFDEWPSTKESWSNLDHGGTDKSTFSKTHLSISIPMSSTSEFSSPGGDACSPDDEFK